MNKTKITAFALSLLLLTGCTNANRGEEGEGSSTGVPDAAELELQAAKTQTEYYRQLVEKLQAELLVVQNTIQTTEAEYEAKLRELEALLGLPAESTHPDFRIALCEGGVMITEYIGSGGEVEIPSMIGEQKVVAIGDRAFENALTLTAVTIPEGVERIGWFAFSGCIKLTSVTLPGSVRSMEYGCFQNCPAGLVVSCPKGSYSEKYANSYGLAVKTSE